MAWKLIHGVFRKGKPRPPQRVEAPPPAPPPPIPPQVKEKVGLTKEQVQALIAGGNIEIKELLQQILAKEQTIILSNNPGEKQKIDNGFKAIEIDESIANVIEQKELEGQVNIKEEETEDDIGSQAEKLSRMLRRE